MFDRHLLPLQHRWLGRPARALARAGVTADGLSIAGFVVGLGVLPLLAGQAYGAALACILLNRLCDGLDGAVARVAGPTDRGAFLDVALDFVFYAAVPFGFALADPAVNALAAAALIFAFVGTGSSFLAFATVAAQRGMAANSPHKGLYYLGGLTEGAETIAVFAAFCLWPSRFPLLALSFAVLCGATTLARWRWGWSAFSQ